MTGRWLTVSRTITRIWAETGRLLTVNDVLRLGKRTGAWGLIVDHSHQHTRVLERSVDDHVRWLKAPTEHANGPTVGRWSRATDPEAFADRAHPDDEGDER